MRNYQIGIVSEDGFRVSDSYASGENSLDALEQGLDDGSVLVPSGFAGYAIVQNMNTGLAVRLQLAKE